MSIVLGYRKTRALYERYLSYKF